MDFDRAAHDQENRLAFGVKGGAYARESVRSQLRCVVRGWLNGQENDRAFHEALNALEDMHGHGSPIRRLCDDLRAAAAIPDLLDRERYLLRVRPDLWKAM